MAQSSISSVSDRVLSSAIIAAAILVAVVVLGWTFRGIKASENQRIVVTGAYSQMVTSNQAVWRGRLQALAPTHQTAYAALSKSKADVMQWLNKKGVKAEWIEAGAVDVMPIYHSEYNRTDYSKVDAIRLNQTITVTASDVSLIQALSQSVGDLLSQGIDIQGESPQYLYTDLDTLKVDSLGKATQNAKERAQSMAKATGASVGALRSVNMGVFQITPPNSTDVSDYGMNDTTTVEKKVTAVVNAVFQLN